VLEQRRLPQLILLRGARQLLTLRGAARLRCTGELQDLSIIEDGAVLIRDGVVDSVGPSRRIENLRDARMALEIPVHGMVVMPGFVDLGLRAFLPSKRRRSFIQTRNDVSTLLRDCLQYGTTSTELESGGSENPADDLTLLRHAAKVGVEDDVVHSWRLQLPPNDSLDNHLEEQFHYVHKHGFARFLALYPGNASLEAFHRTLEMARAAGLKLKLISQQETKDEFLHLAAQYGVNSVTGTFLSPGANLSTIASHHIAAIFRPLLDLRQTAAAPCCLADFINAGGAPVLASGHDEQSPGYSMQAAVELAVFRHGMTLEQALSAATINAAYAADWGSNRGSLEVDKRADLLVLNLPDYRDITHQLGINYVGMVIRRGQVVFNRTSWRAGSAGRRDLRG
jgi:imidazolonepropionase